MSTIPATKPPACYAPKMFRVNGSDYSAFSMLADNEDDEALCEWIKTAQVGDVFPDGETCVRIA